MACNCGKKKPTVEYVVQTPSGTVVRSSEPEAKALATRYGTSYTARTVAA